VLEGRGNYNNKPVIKRGNGRWLLRERERDSKYCCFTKYWQYRIK